MSWRRMTDLVKNRPAAMRLADHLGRSKGRLRLFEPMIPIRRPAHHPSLAGWENHSLAAMPIGHATTLLRLGGMTILTDPVFSNRVGIGLGPLTGGPRRLVAPALRLKELPKIDLILISHAHFDHLDRPTLYKLDKSIPVVTAAGTADLIADLGFGHVSELRWGEGIQQAALGIVALPVAHWGARTFYDRHRGYNGYLLSGGGQRILFGGDSAYHEGFKELATGGRGVDLAILGIGAYNPYIAAHATPEQALAMADHARAQRLMPMHHGVFRLSHEPPSEPLERLLEAEGGRGRLVGTNVGEGFIP